MAVAFGGRPQLYMVHRARGMGAMLLPRRAGGLGQTAATDIFGGTIDCSNYGTWLLYPNPCWTNSPSTWAGITATEQAVNASGPIPQPTPPPAIQNPTPSTYQAQTIASLKAAQGSSAQSMSNYFAGVQQQLANVPTGVDCSSLANVLNPLSTCTWADWLQANWVLVAVLGGVFMVLLVRK